MKGDSESLKQFYYYSKMVVSFASVALPYCHARLAPRQPDLDIKDIKIEDLTDEQIDALVVRLNATHKDDMLH
jgi:hypothetical protein